MESKVTKNENSEVEIDVELTIEEVLKHKNDSLKHLGREIELPGFRKGKAPVDMLEEKVSKEALFRDMAEKAVNESYPRIVSEHNVSPLGRPNITITKLAPGNPLEFKISTPVMPEIALPG